MERLSISASLLLCFLLPARILICLTAHARAEWEAADIPLNCHGVQLTLRVQAGSSMPAPEQCLIGHAGVRGVNGITKLSMTGASAVPPLPQVNYTAL